ncbi:MAG TPA: hypothetical protein DEG69_03605 [Flavobacteriaceae bacterium]|nr:hypothetical protein [Flavobacteriaceae bacterium]
MHKWKNFYKFKEGLAVTNLLYEPLVSKDKKIFCMNWNKNQYHDNEFMTEELYNFWFNQECKYLLHLSNKKYIPEILLMDTKKRVIEFRWYDKNLNVMIENNTINKVKNWQKKIKEIKDDLEKDNIFKINMYPHTFFFDDEGNAHIMDLYGCTDKHSRYLDTKFLKPLIRGTRFDKFIMNESLDTHKLYQETIKTNYAEWPGDFLNA